MNVNDYYHYIEGLAARHSLVAHSPHKKHYFRGELEEFYMDLRNRVNFPAVVAESFELHWEDAGDFKVRETSFIIAADYKESKNWDAIARAMALCERIGDEFLARMMQDSTDGNLCAAIEPVSAVPLLNEQHLYAGIRYTINVKTPFATEANPDMWNETPEDEHHCLRD